MTGILLSFARVLGCLSAAAVVTMFLLSCGPQTSVETDREALEALYRATGGPDWLRNRNWLTNAPLGEWSGVTTDDDGRVIGLDLAANELDGGIPPELGNLDRLKVLDLTGSRTEVKLEIKGQGSGLGNLIDQVVGQAADQLDDPANRTVRRNHLSGCIPVSLHAQLDLESSNLGSLSFCGEGIDGVAEERPTGRSTPQSDDSRAAYPDAEVPGDSFPANTQPSGSSGSGVILPDQDRRALSALFEATNGPGWLNNENWLSDQPLGNWYGVRTDGRSRVVLVELPENRLTGILPPELGDLSNLKGLDLSDNRLSGEIPDQLGRLSELQGLVLEKNRLSGEIPGELGNLTRLEILGLGGNGLTGEIPPELGSLARLEQLSLAANLLEGAIPKELGALSSLTRMILFENRLTGGIPPELGRLRRLEELGLHDNLLIGEIPKELGDLSSLTTLTLFENRLTGGIPPELGRLRRLDMLGLHGNRLTGEIPVELGDLRRLEKLGLYGNDLSGCVPSSLRRQLRVSDTGSIPYCLVSGPETADSGTTDPTESSGLAPPEGQQYSWKGSEVHITWMPVAGADYYRIFHDDFSSHNCLIGRDGTPSFCSELASRLSGMSYVHGSPSKRRNFYWVVACDRSGCSGPDNEGPAEFIDTRPAKPENLQARYLSNGAEIQITWDPVLGADFYRVFYDDFFGDNCRVVRGDDPSFCEELASPVLENSYLHDRPDRRENHYWVSACNDGGCSDVDGADAAVFEGTPPPATQLPVAPRAPVPTTVSSDARSEFEASSPPGYTGVVLRTRGPVWGVPSQFTTDSDPGAVAYMLLGPLQGCAFADAGADRRSRVYVKVQELGNLDEFESNQVCRMTSRQWTTGWNGLRITHLRFFDESASAGIQEYVYDPATGRYAAEVATGSNP